MDISSHKVLLNLNLPSLEILKDFIHIPVSLSGSSVFLQAHISPPPPIPCPGSFYGNLVLALLKILENVILSSSPAKFSMGVKKMHLQTPHLKSLTNNKTDKQH